ncbi:MAG: hypothetical protein ACQGVC_02355 [Myxococcota bacterium]
MSAATRGPTVALVLAAVLFAGMLFGGLSHPLLWNDESFTAVYAERVLEHGYPKVHGERNVFYALDAPLAVGVKEASDAYIGSTWGQYYVGALGVALSRLSDDLHGRTAWVRLPFALVGAGGVACFVAALWPLLGDGRRRRVGAALFLLLASVSISLLLHLREARYYALVVAAGGGLVWLFRAHEVSGTLPAGRYRAGVVATLLFAFVCYYPAALAFGAALAHDAGLRALRGEGGLAARAVPLGVAAALAVPGVLYFEIPQLGRALSAGFDASPGAWAANLATVGLHLLRFEWLGPVLVAKLLLVATPRAESDPRRDLSRFLTGLVLVYWGVVGATPFFFERYFLVLGPALLALGVLDATRVVDGVRGRARGPALALLTAAFAAALVVRAPEVSGRLAELRTPVEGPLDVVIPYLAEAHADPASLVVATNYEEPAYAWYLGSRVVVGFNAAALERDLAADPDVIVPRRPRHRDVLERWVREGGYERRSFPVRNTPTNNVPSLSPRSAGGETHRFVTARPDGRQPVVIFERARP